MNSNCSSPASSDQTYIYSKAKIFFNFNLPVFGEYDWETQACNLIVTEDFWVALDTDDELIWLEDPVGGFGELFDVQDSNFSNKGEGDGFEIFTDPESVKVIKRDYATFIVESYFGVFFVEHDRHDSESYLTGPYSSAESAIFHCDLDKAYIPPEQDALEAEYRGEPIYEDEILSEDEGIVRTRDEFLIEEKVQKEDIDSPEPENSQKKGYLFTTWAEASYFVRLFSDPEITGFGGGLWEMAEGGPKIVPYESKFLVI